MSPPQNRRLPTELLIGIADHLCDDQDFVSVGLTCKDLYALLVKKKRRSLQIDFDGSCTACALPGAPRLRSLNQQTAMLMLPGIEDTSEHLEDGKKMAAVSQRLSQNDYKLGKGIKELTLSGYFPSQDTSGYALTSHPFTTSSGFKEIRPETLKVNLGWDDWDFDILHGMSVTNLKVLRLPLRLPSDCVRLGMALTIMPSLASLAITNIPDREEFLKELKHIGKGILSCASTLRELDIEMTNFNRPASWDKDERFIEPKDNGSLFCKLFPCPPMDDISALFERHSRQGTDTMVEAPLSLTKLRLKHVSLPRYSFGIVFNTMTVKHLHLPYSKVDEGVWKILKIYSQLDSLTDISYDMLSAGFLDFLGEQSSLKELTFARPQDRFDATDVTFYGANAHMMIRVSEEAPRVGPDAGAKYPSLDHFLSSLQEMRKLKHLGLPADMFTITRDCLFSIAQSLSGLEHLELGFDYNDTNLQRMFASCFLCGNPILKKITFFSLKQPQPLPDFDTAHFQALIASLGAKVSANLKLVRYMPLNQVHGNSYGDVEVYYHRQTPVDGEWWMRLPQNEREQIFAEGHTPRVVPVGKLDWEIEAPRSAYWAGLERRTSGSQGRNE